jgi:hypothetical protein
MTEKAANVARIFLSETLFTLDLKNYVTKNVVCSIRHSRQPQYYSTPDMVQHGIIKFVDLFQKDQRECIVIDSINAI